MFEFLAIALFQFAALMGSTTLAPTKNATPVQSVGSGGWGHDVQPTDSTVHILGSVITPVGRLHRGNDVAMVSHTGRRNRVALMTNRAGRETNTMAARSGGSQLIG